jgi:hypothetical protein
VWGSSSEYQFSRREPKLDSAKAHISPKRKLISLGVLYLDRTKDLYLSATTWSQIIVATEADRQGKKDLPYFEGIEASANRMGIHPPSPDFKNM